MSGVKDKAWISLRFPDPLFHPGVKSFLNFAKVHLPGIEKIKCPCTKCGNMRISRSYDDVEFHLIKYGFTSTYTLWTFHGEVATDGDIENDFQSHDEDIDAYMNDLADGTVDPTINVQDTMRSMHEFPAVVEENAPSESVVQEFMKALYPGCESFTVGSLAVKLFDLKLKHQITDKGFTDILKLFKDVLPHNNEVPSNKYRAEKVIKDVTLGYEKIHVCRNDCILYWGKHAEKEKCPTCGVSRYKIEKISNKYPMRRPVKVLWYFPITPRLERMYNVPWVAKEMTWHLTGRMPAGKMRHPVDSTVWKSLDSEFTDFSSEPRNVRLGLATDGFNPFGTWRSSYSCWPVMCVPYNLPPNLCMKPEFTMLALLIEGPRQPGNDIDVFLQPLVKELEDLWDNGAMIFDAFNRNKFNMRAALLWTIHDFPAYGNISGCQTKGRFACPICGPNIDSLWLRYGKKFSYGNFRRWLSMIDEFRSDTNPGSFNSKVENRRQPLRLHGDEIETITSGLQVNWGKAKKKKKMENEGNENSDASKCFTKRSILFNLKYWKHISVRHNLDVMHIEKNVCEILMALMLNTKKKTKDDANARRDLKCLKLKKGLWLKKKNGKTNLFQPACRVWLRKEEKRLFLQTLRELRVPIGFSSNWKNLVSGDTLDLKCLKSHDYHILMQHLLPMLIQHAFKDRKEVRQIIRSFSTFFNAICSRVIDVDTISVLERGMAKTLCMLEKICPPSVFVVMMHLPIHLAYEVRVCGPVYYRWMYPFERFMKTFKGYVGNKAHPEACIAERYIKEEAILYCKSYRGEGEAIFRAKGERNIDISIDEDDNDEFDSDDANGLIGSGKKFLMSSLEYEQARRWVLKSHPSYDMWERKYVEAQKGHTKKKAGSSKVSKHEEFILWLKKETIGTDDKDFVDVVNGPRFFAKRYKKCCTNGFLFVTKDWEENKRYQNSGVCTKSITICRSSAKDKAPVDEQMEYYGVLKDIIQLEYHGGYMPVLFKCDWVKMTRNGVKWDEEANLRLVNLSNMVSHEQLLDEPFMLAEHAQQVFYSRDPLDLDWHVVLEVPPKIYDEEIHFLSNPPDISGFDVGLDNIELVLNNELMYSDPEDAGVDVDVQKSKKRKRSSAE